MGGALPQQSQTSWLAAAVNTEVNTDQKALANGGRSNTSVAYQLYNNARRNPIKMQLSLAIVKFDKHNLLIHMETAAVTLSKLYGTALRDFD